MAEDAKWERGCVQVYTGDGKGKTTAAFGLALRAAGAGLRVFIAQFMKGRDCGELHTFEKLSDQIAIKQYGREGFIHGEPDEEDIRAAREGLEEAILAIQSGDYDLVILDEANVAVDFELFSIDDLLAAIDERPEHVELVITGRKAHPRLIERADLVTEMREVKHYYQDGLGARRGIEY